MAIQKRVEYNHAGRIERVIERERDRYDDLADEINRRARLGGADAQGRVTIRVPRPINSEAMEPLAGAVTEIIREVAQRLKEHSGNLRILRWEWEDSPAAATPARALGPIGFVVR